MRDGLEQAQWKSVCPVVEARTGRKARIERGEISDGDLLDHALYKQGAGIIGEMEQTGVATPSNLPA